MKNAKKIALVLSVVGVGGLGIATLYADSPLGSLSGKNSTEANSRAAEIEHQIKSDFHDIVLMQAESRRLKDVIKLNCVNDKLILVKAEMNIADAARQQVQVEISVGSKPDRESWFSQLVASETRIRDLRQEADACLGKFELAKESGSTYTHPDFPDDPSVIPFDIYTEPPAYASPFN